MTAVSFHINPSKYLINPSDVCIELYQAVPERVEFGQHRVQGLRSSIHEVSLKEVSVHVVEMQRLDLPLQLAVVRFEQLRSLDAAGGVRIVELQRAVSKQAYGEQKEKYRIIIKT